MDRPAQEPESRRHDQTYKLLFSHAPAATHLVRDFAAKGWSCALDLATLEPFPTESVSPDLRRRLGDCAWRAWLRDGRASVVFLVEFQSSVDREMLFRTMNYSQAAHLAFHRYPGLRDPGDAMPYTMSVVVYSGVPPWTAATTLAELACRRTASLPEAALWLGGSGTHSHGHRLLDLQSTFAQNLLPKDSVLDWIAAMERAPWTHLPRVRRSLARCWGGPEHSAVRRALAAWADERLRVASGPDERRRKAVDWITQPRGEDDMETYEDWARGHEERGRAKEGRAMVVRLASRRFGAETAQQLEGLVEGMDVKELARVGDAVVDCDTGDELLEAAENGPKS